MIPTVHCPKCHDEAPMTEVLTAQSNQNVIYQCRKCKFERKDIETSKG
jgi:uncharacterized Zn finger protein